MPDRTFNLFTNVFAIWQRGLPEMWVVGAPRRPRRQIP